MASTKSSTSKILGVLKERSDEETTQMNVSNLLLSDVLIPLSISRSLRFIK